jgi:hypothetical protein
MSKPFVVSSLAVVTLALTAISAQAAPLPRTGKILKMTNGDLMCYLEVKNPQGKVQSVGADFEICQQKQFLNRRVRFTYKKVAINDCESAEPCGKTRLETIAVRLQLLHR